MSADKGEKLKTFEALSILQREFLYRCEIFWKLYFKFFIAIVSVFAVYFTYALDFMKNNNPESQKGISIVFIIALLALGITSTVVMIQERNRLTDVHEIYKKLKAKESIFTGKISSQKRVFYYYFCFTLFGLSIVFGILIYLNR